jgi:acetoacetate decarboxylase
MKTKSLTMPTLFPANPIWGDQRTIHYNENTTFVITYITEKKAIAPYLPEGFSAPDSPMIAVNYVMCRGIVEMGGMGYNLVSITVCGRYKGKKEFYDGDLSLVVWENKFPPVYIGREFVGYPKLVVEIDDAVENNGERFLEGEVSGLQKMSDKECAKLSSESVSDFKSGFLHMAYKVFPGPNYNDAPVVTQVCGVVHRDDLKEAWNCKGSIKWHPVTPEKSLVSYGIVEALSKLPVIKYNSCMVTKGPHIIELGNSRGLK